MKETTNIVSFRQPSAVDDPLTEILRNGAGELLARAVEIEQRRGGRRPIDADLRCRRQTSIARHGHPGQADRTGLTLAERLCRTVDRIDPARVSGPVRQVKPARSSR